MSGLPALPIAAMRPSLMPDIGLDDAPVIENDRVGDHRIDHLGGGPLALTHAVADDLAAAELDLLAVDRVIAARSRSISSVSPRRTRSPRGRTEHLGIGAPRRCGSRQADP